ncbi:MAG: glycosyltransferase [Rhodoferax sp.]|uniref:glycosyltransferase n=1 Tax=Rhodoferax sp. TaxID=50421 RepID=UPI002ACE3C99|nr:glycosyltransferase [Rhodoferax sp.]MDZ7891011.1 glycosyltransferase [Rhodoferax sp.]
MALGLPKNNQPLVLVMCNALDDATRLQRQITTDSPAASRKVFNMCLALKLAGVRAYVLSLGRGRASGSGDCYRVKVCRVDRVLTVYAPFSHLRVWSELLSLFGHLKAVYRFASRPNKVIVFYNRQLAYLPSLYLASFLGYKCFLDLEDGEVESGKSLGVLSRFLVTQFEKHCRSGALLACSALEPMTSIRPTLAYYGTAESNCYELRLQSTAVTCLMPGTLTPSTGADTLAEAIRRLRDRQPAWCDLLTFEITGKGASLPLFQQLAATSGVPRVHVHGRTTDNRYREILNICDVGLALKPVGGHLADTTFPSKVIEFAGAGLLVLSSDISDVRAVFGDGARYLDRNDPESLIVSLAGIVRDRIAAQNTAKNGRQTVVNRFAPFQMGKQLRAFFFESNG